MNSEFVKIPRAFWMRRREPRNKNVMTKAKDRAIEKNDCNE